MEEWFSRKTSIAGTPFPNWALVVANRRGLLSPCSEAPFPNWALVVANRLAGPNGTTEEGKANRVSLRSGRVGGVQRMHRGAFGSDGYGFLIQDDDGKPKLALCYKTQEDADDAACPYTRR
jgi:hypothetical protein